MVLTQNLKILNLQDKVIMVWQLLQKQVQGEVAVAVTKIINKHARDIVIENLHLAAGSGGIQVGASPQQMKARARYLGMKEDELILVDSMKEYDALLGAGFHLKIL